MIRFLTANDFDGKLNLDGFTNIEKSLTQDDFDANFKSDAFMVFEEKNIREYIETVQKAIGGDIVKGGFNDTEELNEISKSSLDLLSKMTVVKVNNGDSSFRKLYALEKCHITDALSYGQSVFKFSKEGKDIIEKVMNEKAKIEKENMDIQKRIEECQEKFTCLPTETMYLHGVEEHVNNPYRLFAWNQCSYGESMPSYIGEGETDCQPCGSAEEAEFNQKYNSLVREWVNNCAEIMTLDMYEKNIQENKSYELTPDQMLALKF